MASTYLVIHHLVLKITQSVHVSACSLNLVHCGYKETGQKCQTRKCACMKAGLLCTERALAEHGVKTLAMHIPVTLTQNKRRQFNVL